METYKIKDLTFSYPNRESPVLADINLTVKPGDFVTLCGPSGCGKTTLLRQLKPATAPHGIKSGTISFEGTLLDELSERDAASKIGFVLQSPENQIVTDKVWHELAFGLESLGAKTSEIRLRVSEMASFFGIQTWFHKSVTELSGGQKQLLALASIMAMQPHVLILDEPTSQLDPIAAGEFLATISKINRELGVTVILTEHRLEEAFPLSTKAVVMENGRIIVEDEPHKVGLDLLRLFNSSNQTGESHGMFLAMPVPMRVWAACANADEIEVAGGEAGARCPITVRDGTEWLKNQPAINTGTGANQSTRDTAEKSKKAKKSEKPEKPGKSEKKVAVTLQDVWFRYEKNLPDVVKGLSFEGHYGEVTAILGGNGTGKTTTLSLIAGLHKPYRGKVHADTRVFALPQNPQALFVAKTVREDLLEVLSEDLVTEAPIPKEEKNRRLAVIVKLCRLEGLLDSHPYDLSGGEQQRAALAKVLLLRPKILLLDEPTKGLDAEYKQIFAAILRKMTGAGAAVVMVSHDVEFCAEHADRCSLYFDGNIVTENSPREFFSGNSFYTTSANRMSRNILPGSVTVGDIVQTLGGELPPAPEILDMDAEYEMGQADIPSLASPKPPKLTMPRLWSLLFFSLWLMIILAIGVLNWNNLNAFIGGGQRTMEIAREGAGLYIAIMVGFSLGIIGVTLSLFWNRGQKRFEKQKSRKLSKRTIVASLMILLTIPLTIYLGIQFFDQRQFYLISTLIMLQTMMPFALVFENRKPQAREIVIIAVLCTIAVAGRSAFFMLPQFKPVIAMVIISGVAFGGEAGFLVGAMTFLVSNMFFGQGPWTPWQMFAGGIIGFLAGILFRRGLLSRNPLPLAVFGGFATFIIFGPIMNIYSLLIVQPNPNVGMLMLYLMQGIPFDIIHSVATVTFLILISKPMLEKLDRIKVKYGLVE